MPIYIKITDIKGDVSPAGSGNGGVWKTSNFLTNDPVGRRSKEPGLPGVTVFLDQNNSSALNPRPKIKTYICPSDPSVVPIASISLSPSGGGVEGRDPAVKVKLEQMINSASRMPHGKLYIATDTGVYQNGIAGHGRVLVGNDQGVWRSGGANKFNGSNNLRQIGLAAQNASVEFIVTDDAGKTLSTFRLERASVSRHSGGINVVLCDGSVRF